MINPFTNLPAHLDQLVLLASALAAVSITLWISSEMILAAMDNWIKLKRKLEWINSKK